MSTTKKSTARLISAAATAIMMFFTVFAVLPMIDSSKVYAAGETAQVTADLLNVRSGAGTNYSRIGSLSRGKTFTVTGSANDRSGTLWYRLNYNSKTGYVSSEYVNIKQPTVTPVSNLNGTVNITSGVLNVRSGPGSSYSRIGSLAKGKTFSVTGKAQDSSGTWWYTFSYSGKTGYVTSQYVKTTSTASSTTTVTDTTGTVNITSGVLYVRSGPGTSYSKLGSLTKGKTFTVTGKAQDSSGKWWYAFSYNGKTGYVHSQYVTTKTVTSDTGSTENTGDSSTAVTGTGKVSAGGDPLRVRSGPGTSYGTLGLLSDGKTFTFTDEVKDGSGKIWYKTTYNGKTGYVYGAYVKVLSKESDKDDTQIPENDKEYEPVTFQIGTVDVDDGLNVRSGAGTSYSRLGLLSDGTTVTITGSAKDKNGKVWYTYQFSSSKTGYICSDYVKVKTVTSDSQFEAYMDAQGFPDSYKAGLRTLHAAHPQWVFKAVNLNYTWSDALAKQTSKQSANLVSPSSPVSYRNPSSYNSSTKTWYRPDSGWYVASDTVVAYYMDPRNFLNESSIYQFMTHKYDAASQNANTVAEVIKGSFMQSKNPGGGYSSYATLINDAGKNSGVNPNVLASMIIQEQGWSGSSLVSGTYSGYAGYYNFFNIGAYQTDSMNAVQRGLWYAKGGDTGATSYSRPWNTPYKSILGGAQFYGDEYLTNNQYTYYTKRFNVNNGLSSIATHQYMTNVAGAASEGSIVKRAYENNDNYPIIFEIPVFKNMPANACQLP